jgi:hypothetical protein
MPSLVYQGQTMILLFYADLLLRFMDIHKSIKVYLVIHCLSTFILPFYGFIVTLEKTYFLLDYTPSMTQ